MTLSVKIGSLFDTIGLRIAWWNSDRTLHTGHWFGNEDDFVRKRQLVKSLEVRGSASIAVAKFNKNAA